MTFPETGAVEALDVAVSRMEDFPFFLTTIKDPALQKGIEERGGKVINKIDYFQLARSAMPEATPLAFPEGYRLEVHEYVPEPLCAPLAALMTELMGDIVRETPLERFAESPEGLARKVEQFRTTGTIMLLFIVREPLGNLVGCTFVLISRDSTTAKQELTGIVRAHRGRGLARSLKTLAIQETFRRFPHVHALETNCYRANEPIIRLNRSLGFTYRDTALQYKVHRATILKTHV